MLQCWTKDFYIFRESSLLRKLKAFSASKMSMASVSGSSISLLKLWLAYLIPHFCPEQSYKIFPIFLGSDFKHCVIVLPIICLKTSHIPKCLTREFMSKRYQTSRVVRRWIFIRKTLSAAV